MDKEITGLSVKGVSYVATRSLTEFNIKTLDRFAEGMTIPLQAREGTVGEMNRKYLHTLLDEWVDNAIKGE